MDVSYSQLTFKTFHAIPPINVPYNRLVATGPENPLVLCDSGGCPAGFEVADEWYGGCWFGTYVRKCCPTSRPTIHLLINISFRVVRYNHDWLVFHPVVK